MSTESYLCEKCGHQEPRPFLRCPSCKKLCGYSKPWLYFSIQFAYTYTLIAIGFLLTWGFDLSKTFKIYCMIALFISLIITIRTIFYILLIRQLNSNS